MHNKAPEASCGEQCGVVVAERNRYFTGKYMTARDFADEQMYHVSHHRLHNRLMHGWGVVCGLEVKPHPNEDCRDRWVIVEPGIALDCCGRELVLEKRQTVKVWDGQQDSEQASATTAQTESYPPSAPNVSQAPSPKPTEPVPGVKAKPKGYLLCLQYHECACESVPVLYAEGECDPKKHQPNRVREDAEIVVMRFEEVRDGCWLSNTGGKETPCKHDCGDTVPSIGGGCLSSDCDCGECVPLALIQPAKRSSGYWIGKDEIDTSGQRKLPIPREYMTHIVDYNWTHGGEMTMEDLRTLGQDICQDPSQRSPQGGKLVVRFDREIKLANGDATGVNPFTFVVEYGGLTEHLEFLPYDLNKPAGLCEDDPCTAVFTIDPDILDRRSRTSLVDTYIFVTLKCDFIMDCHNNPVDGDHLRGRCPTGDGTEGGVFESWFRVVSNSQRKEQGA